MAALGATTLLQTGSRVAATWVLLAGLFLSVISLFMLPRAVEQDAKVAPVPVPNPI
jgi:hypothetical protein